MFNDVGDYSFPFKVPALQGICQSWDGKTVSIDPKRLETFDGSIRWNGIVLYVGQIKIKTASDKTFEGTLYINKGDFNYEVKDLILTSIDFGMKSFPTDQDAVNYFNWSLTHFYPEVDFSLPEIANMDFFDPVATNPELMLTITYSRMDSFIKPQRTDKQDDPDTFSLPEVCPE